MDMKTWANYNSCITEVLQLGISSLPVQSITDLESIVLAYSDSATWKLSRMRSALTAFHQVLGIPPPPFDSVQRLLRGVRGTARQAGPGARAIGLEELWEYAAVWAKEAHEGSLVALRNVAALFLQFFGGKRSIEVRRTTHEHLQRLGDGSLRWLIPYQKKQANERVALIMATTEGGNPVAPVITALMDSVPRDGGFLLRSTEPARGGNRVWGRGSSPWERDDWNRQLDRVRTLVNEERARQVPPLPGWPPITSHGIRKGTMCALVAAGIDHRTASQRVLHHQGTSSWMSYLHDEPRLLAPVVAGLYR